MLRSVKRAPLPPVDSSSISMDELIRGQLQGKLIALARYDEILWKIRTGYVAVLYGALAFLVGKESRLGELLGSTGHIHCLFPITLGLSVCALLIDASFLLAKLRVVVARDRLSDLAAARAVDAVLDGQESREIIQLLHLSGEAFTLPPPALIVGGMWSLLGVYLFTPLVLLLLTRFGAG